MRTIWKFSFRLKPEATFSMPKGAEIIHVAEQHGDVHLWAIVDDAKTAEERKFFLIGTGHPLPDVKLSHLGTALVYHGDLVLHVFEREEL